MFINYIISLFIFLLLCNVFDFRKNMNRPNWINGLANYIEQDSSTHQTMLIINEDLFTMQEKIETILREIKHVKPSVHFLVRNKTIEKDIRDLKHLKSFGSLTTTFFIIIDDDQTELRIEQEMIKMIRNLLNGRFRPKCLILQFSEAQKPLDPTKEKLLRTAWNIQFLDVSILEIVGNTSKMHYFNPFRKMFSTKKYRIGTVLFPDKVRNLNCYQLTASVIHYPPHVYIEYNTFGYPVNYSGSDVLLLNTFAKKMNFSVKFESGIRKKAPTAFFTQQLLSNKLQISLIRITMTPVGKYSSLEQLITGFGSVNALIPKIHNQVDFDELNFLYALVPIVVFSAMLCLLMYILKLLSNDWNLSFTIQVVLSLTVPEQPESLKARIMFAYMVIVSFVYSSKIYALVTNINLQSISERQLETLAELDKSGLKIEVDPIIIDWMSSDLQNLSIVKQSFHMFSSTEECILQAISAKNISCVMLKTDANWFSSHFKGKDGTTLTATVEEPFVVATEGFYLEPGSPYVERFNTLLLKLMAFGIFAKWNKDEPRMSPTERNKEILDDLSISYNTLFPILVTELLVGFLISTIVFVIEIFIAKIKKGRLNSK